MAELQPVDGQQTNGGVVTIPASTSAEATAIAAAGSKRLRRPSVRLGEIGGDQYQQQHHHHAAAAAYDSQGRKSKWTPTTTSGNRKDTSKSSRTRTLTNLSSGYENIGTLDDEREGNVDSFGVGSWRVKKRVGSSAAAKRVRSNWVSKVGDGDEKISGGEELEGGFRDFSREDSESPIKEESLDRDGGGFYGRRRYESNNSSGNREFESNMDGGGKEGVKIWLQELGLGRYWPMFEIHEVDEEVLPLLTLEDLKDMGINAVGSRRKMFCAIQKLGREFS
ncbi:hypothetical protein [Arabidopsis thaliana]|jgi:hypothetical protein|uniref:Sterile alpha motif (SAM) domain-containing protein n=3 Tax=Arabidopsis TaxID=3701 RepID=Q9M303_ARATH|nr:Sterile alpha motif (SAM) domain-containing protein [Arabidopsis thaliana]KAG7633735.1 Sterile alpha motif domain [Arabidopsis suecica]AEE78457.1 Sterile alpha motif (SAM) domain-containing protein [Arabidopsis thaliana]CAA0385128.1 unnamed protein product [Arabidopsis thaliana]CAB87908.1 hypothetical protein [Arabidopsis thaliana]CAD5325248.1 unnamed protein product [Arabidopsis thaliana]|eukprot:NP_190449.1 Sterile alpha motif (SAM) domain-containing protein [Arabidopsis thaliana]